MSLISKKLSNTYNIFDNDNKYAAFKFLSNNLHQHIYNQFIDEFIASSNVKEYPIIFAFLQENKNFTLQEFYQHVISNDNNLTDNEFIFIDKYFVSSYNSNIIFNVLSSSISSLSKRDFNKITEDLVSMDKHSFKYLLNQLKITQYALHNFSSIEEDLLNKAFSVININQFKYKFLECSINHNRPILHTVFYETFSDKENVHLNHYLENAIKNNWTNHLVYLVKKFPQITESYINKIESFSDKHLLNFEKLFLYVYPKKINTSHLNDTHIAHVFDKIHNNIPNKNYNHVENIQFYKNLGESLFKFIEIAYNKDKENIQHFLFNEHALQSLKFLKSPTFLNDTNKIYLFNYLLFNHEFIDVTLKNTYKLNIINPLTEEFFTKNYLVDNLIDLSTRTKENIFIDFLSKNFHYLNKNQQKKVLFNLVEDYFLSSDQTQFIDVFRNKLTCLSIEFLQILQIHLENCINSVDFTIVKDRKEQSQLITKIFYNALLEKKLVKEEAPKQKRLKI